MKKDTYIVWDLETTGLVPATCHILEIGAMEVVKGEVIARHTWVLNNEVEIPEVITQITGITKELIQAEGKDPRNCVREFMALLEKYDTHITHNGIKFDVPFLTAQITKLLHNADVSLVVEYHSELLRKQIDTAVICKAKKLGMDREPQETFKQWADRVMSVRAFGVKYNVGVMCSELGIDTSKVTMHRALGDVELTNEIYKKVATA